MNKKRLLTVSIGVPAHNESQNIRNLLHFLSQQEQNAHILEKIYVICDGCTDKTEQYAKQIARKNSHIIVKNDKKRKGKSARLNELYHLNTSQILVTIDADVIPSNVTLIDKLVEPFYDKKVGVVGGNSQPFPAQGFQERIINIWFAYWYEVRKDEHNGHNVHNIHGAISAIRNSLAKQITYPPDVIANSKYLYFATMVKKLQFIFVKDAVTYFYSPTTFKDFMLQTNRYGSENSKNLQKFGKIVDKAYYIPMRKKITALVHIFLKQPLLTPLVVVFYIFLRLNHSKTSSIEPGNFWKTVNSTKRTFDTVNLPHLRVKI